MNKLEKLREVLQSYGKVAIAYSGGCDSNFLMNVAVQTIGKDNVLCVVCIGAMMSKEDIENARMLLKEIPHVEVPMDVFSVEAFRNNDRRRCYFCKKQVMSAVIKEANARGFAYIADGKNLDDEGEYRPGIEACEELGIISPLSTAGFTKKDVRMYSEELGIVTFNKPSNACLASRFNYGTELTKEKLEIVDKAEALFHKEGMQHVRVRVHDTLARIEIPTEHFDQVYKNTNLIDALTQLGFRYITLDLKGITSGSYD